MLEQPTREREIHEVLQEARRAFEEGKLLAKVFNEPGIFDLEIKKIFAKSWVFLAHESEIPDPGDYVVRRIVNDTFVISRDEHGEIHVLFNMCRHRGMQVCRSDAGNASHFRCPYHGWTYKNNGKLNGVPFNKEVFGPGGLNKEEWGLTPAPKAGVYEGMIFACMNPEAPSLEEYIGEAGWYLDFLLKKSPAGMEVVGAPQRWVVSSDWKLPADNFFGDGYHTQSTHMSTIQTGIMRVKKVSYLKDGVQIRAGIHGGGFMAFKPGTYLNYPRSIVESMLKNLSPEQVGIIEEHSILPLNFTIFPNLSFLNSALVAEQDGRSVPFLTMRLWQPMGPGKMEIWSWCLVEKDAPEEFKKASARAYLATFGTSGTFEQDDAENWRNVTKVAAGEMAGQHYLNYRMGLDHVRPLPGSEWPGPGTAYPKMYVDFAQRLFWSTYFDHLLK